MGKWIKKIIATRLLYYATNHRLIPPNQFGAMPGKSTTDAALCLAHDIQAANNHNLFTSLVTFDITGYFDNVNHNRLLSILHNKGIPLPICKWVRSFVSRRETRIRVDGYTDRAKAVRTGCPQGSPVSGVLANYYSAPLLEMFLREHTRNQDEPAQNMDNNRNCHTPVTAGLFVDEGSLYMASSSPTTNTRRLKIAFEKVIIWAGQNGLKIDMNKVDYICFTCPHKRKIPPIPPMILPTSTNTGEVRRYEPQPHIKWLGLIFDSRLSFRQHVQHLTSRGAAAAGCLRMLANTKGGLSHQNMKILYNTCILPTLSYALPVWWNGKKSQIQKIEKIQNRCLRTIMPVFTTTPIHAMQVESGVPPLHIRLNHMKQRAAARLAAKTDPTNPVHERLPAHLQREAGRHETTPPPLPITPARRKPGMPNRFKSSTIHEITKDIPGNIEKITPTHTTPPWRSDVRDVQYTTRLTTNPAQRGFTKGEAANEHRTRIIQISQENDYIITYTDGSMKEKNQEHRMGAGWVVYWKGMERRSGGEGMGSLAEVYDAEMTALLRGLEAAIEFQQEAPDANRRRTKIVLFTDNTASVTAIMKEAPGSSQLTSQRFVETAIKFLDTNRRATIEVSWVPGHMEIEGNNRADEIAKEATDLEPITETTTLAKLHRQLCERLKLEWISEWANKPMTGRYAIADRIPPSVAGSHAFRTLNRHMVGIITQTRTGQGHVGEYYQIIPSSINTGYLAKLSEGVLHLSTMLGAHRVAHEGQRSIYSSQAPAGLVIPNEA